MSVEDLLKKLKNIVGEELFDKLKIAYLKAEEAHKKQLRFNREPYIVHPLRVCIILAEELKIKDEKILMIGLLHDVVEDSDITIEQIKELFGKRVADGVSLLTKSEEFKVDIVRQKKYFWHLKRAPKKFQLVKLADRLDNLRDLVTCNDELKKRKYILDTEYNYITWAKVANPYIAGELEDLIFKYRDQFGDFDL